MTHDEICMLKDRVYDGIKMVVDKAEKVGKEKKEYSMDDLGKMSDVVKDCAEAIKDLAKAHYYMAEHSEEKY